MTISDFTFYLPEEQFQSITAESNDFFNNYALSFSCFLPASDKKRSFYADDRTQQRQKNYHRIIRKLADGNLPGKEHAISCLQHKYRRNLKTGTLRCSGDKDLPKTVIGKPGQSFTGVDIMMFKMPVPGEQREKLQGTVGFGVNKQRTNKEQKQTAPEPEKDK